MADKTKFSLVITFFLINNNNNKAFIQTNTYFFYIYNYYFILLFFFFIIALSSGINITLIFMEDFFVPKLLLVSVCLSIIDIGLLQLPP